MAVAKARFLWAVAAKMAAGYNRLPSRTRKPEKTAISDPSLQNAILQNDCAAFPGCGAGNVRLLLVVRAQPHRPEISRRFRIHLKCQSNRTSC